MFKYVLRRIVVAVPMLFGAMSIVFFAMRILPGDPCVAMMGDQATTEALADCTRNLGLNRPLPVQYVDYLWRSVQFDFGSSLRQGYPVSEYIARMFPHTLVLVLSSAVVAALIGIPIGIISALKRRSPLIDYPLRIIALLGLSMPVFWLGILLILVFAVHLRWLPVYGGEGVLALVLPTVTLGVWAMARTARCSRVSSKSNDLPSGSSPDHVRPRPEAAGDSTLAHTVARMLSRTKRTMSWVDVPGVNSSLTPIALSSAMSSAGMIPPPNTAMSSAPFSRSSSSTRAKR